MNEKSILIRTAMSIGFYPVTDNTQTFIQIPCPKCNRQMMVRRNFHYQIQGLSIVDGPFNVYP